MCESNKKGIKISGYLEKKGKMRAENRAEQEKWMEAVLSALNQKQPNTTKLSHFRYSLDDLATKTTQDNLVRQNTMPERGKPTPKNTTDLVQRLKQIGAQSYGGSLNSITKPVKCSSPKLPKSKNVTKMLSNSSLYACVNTQNANCSRNSLIIDNDQYARIVPKSGSLDNFILRHKKDTNENIYERVSNVHHHNIEKSKSDENIYAVPKVDHNKNSLNIENEQYVPTQNCETIEYYPVQEGLYEDPDRIKIEETSSQSSNETKCKRPSRLKNFKEKFKKNRAKPKECEKNLKKSYSFVQKVLKRKPKVKDTKRDHYERVDLVPQEKMEEDKNLKMLSELHDILVNKKQILEDYVKNAPKQTHQSKIVELYKPPNFLQDYEVHPNLPPKVTAKGYQTTPKNNPVKLRQPPIESMTKLKTIDEILDDLDKEKQEQDSKPKVKQLIKQFSGIKMEETEVVLRRPNEDVKTCGGGGGGANEKRHSDDLYRLLEELTKVTSAPILTPGATSSLVTPTLTDEEWLKLLPIRKRRFSDPDYDVPRPHRSLQIQPREENPENVIPATRFFGPVLPSSNLNENVNQPSITPDSLDQIDHTATESYCSHHYHEMSKTVCEEPFTIDTEPFALYSIPKQHHHGHLKKMFADTTVGDANIQKHPNKPERKEHSKKSPEVFIDSLEPYVEISTSF